MTKESPKGRHWRERAQECRTAAQGMRDPVSKNQVLEVANSYEVMAEHADETAKRLEEIQNPIRFFA